MRAEQARASAHDTLSCGEGSVCSCLPGCCAWPSGAARGLRSPSVKSGCVIEAPLGHRVQIHAPRPFFAQALGPWFEHSCARWCRTCAVFSNQTHVWYKGENCGTGAKEMRCYASAFFTHGAKQRTVAAQRPNPRFERTHSIWLLQGRHFILALAKPNAVSRST